ncbi:MAG TPA: nucleotide exchange factor GrpE [Solirubrobacteraceae bacterium]|nr:nucleotide exchange factor GrpE [Solirubrobacteraceae bacterium]
MSDQDASAGREETIAAATGPASGPVPADGAGAATGTDERPVAQDADVDVAAQRDEYLALAQRTQADFENYKRRVSRDLQGARQRGGAELARELLPALDNLDRAIDHADQDDPLLTGVRLVREELVAALGRAGIVAFSPLGEQFDPTLHEAVATAPAPDPGASGTVLDVYQSGYRSGEVVIRPARVVVAA